jgi:hypothetical protein
LHSTSIFDLFSGRKVRVICHNEIPMRFHARLDLGPNEKALSLGDNIAFSLSRPAWLRSDWNSFSVKAQKTA